MAPGQPRAQWQADIQASLAATTHWVAVSQFTSRRMTELLGIGPDRITVIPLAARSLGFPSAEAMAEVKTRLHLPENYLLHLGDIQPRKNIEIILEAYATLPAAQRQQFKLVLCGRPAWGDRAFWKRLAGHRAAGEVLMTGHVDDATVAALLKGAVGLLSASRYEGFGLPLLEAMSCRTAVICSRIEGFVEVAGAAAHVVDCDDVQGWASAMKRILADPEWRTELAARGSQRAAEFSWKATVQRHVDLIRQVVAR